MARCSALPARGDEYVPRHDRDRPQSGSIVSERFTDDVLQTAKGTIWSGFIVCGNVGKLIEGVRKMTQGTRSQGDMAFYRVGRNLFFCCPACGYNR